MLLLRDGDCFGPVVNRAARAAHAAAANTVVIASVGTSAPIGSPLTVARTDIVRLDDIDEPVRLDTVCFAGHVPS
jgi:class 3 adenylate cyclase